MKSEKKKLKRTVLFAQIYDIEAIETYLEEKARQGWMFIKCSGMFYVFEQCEPINVKLYYLYSGFYFQ